MSTETNETNETNEAVEAIESTVTAASTTERTDTVEVESAAIPAAIPVQRRTVSLPLSSIAWVAAGSALLVAACVLAGFLIAARGEISDNRSAAARDAHAEQVATDYAVGASTINFADLNSWLGRLKAGTTPQLANKFEATAPQLQQILGPLKWTSNAAPIAAKVLSADGGVYKVDVFLNVNSTTVQNPNGGQTTVTYSVAVDSRADWKISDVGGTGAALPVK